MSESPKPLIASSGLSYSEFLERKTRLVQPCGFSLSKARISSKLFPFQRDVAVFDLDHGKAGNFLRHYGYGPAVGCCCGLLIVDDYNGTRAYKAS